MCIHRNAEDRPRKGDRYTGRCGFGAVALSLMVQKLECLEFCRSFASETVSTFEFPSRPDLECEKGK